MALRITATALLMLGVFAGPAAAQQRAATEPQVDVSKLPVSVERLREKLRQAVEREEREGPRLRYSIDVVAQAPRIQIVTPQDNVRFTPAPYGAPTHREMMNIVTPREFSAPVMDLSNLWRWSADRAKGK